MVFDCARVCGKSVATSEAAVIWQHSRFRSSKIGRWRNFPRTFFFGFVLLMLHLHPLLLMVLNGASEKMAKTFPRFCGTFWCETCSALCSFVLVLRLQDVADKGKFGLVFRGVWLSKTEGGCGYNFVSATHSATEFRTASPVQFGLEPWEISQLWSWLEWGNFQGLFLFTVR